jgi:alkanesulfonate monooxygenase SsuD/methylene tetrahydromethanopterin reductase-like flavin-dependent oxidoreductase (luciferase family)
MKFGVRMPHDGPFASKRSIVKVAKEAEALGYDSVWVHDNIYHGEEGKYHISAGTKEAVDKVGYETHFYESLSTLNYVSAVTERIRLGVAAVILPLRNPFVLAKQVATIQEFSGGRLILGVCVGSTTQSAQQAFKALGVPHNKRGRIMEEYLPVLRAILSGQEMDFEGKYIEYHSKDLLPGFYPRPKHVDIWYAGSPKVIPKKFGPPAIRRTAKYCDGWIPGMGYTVSKFEPAIEKLKVYMEKYGRKMSEMEIALETFGCFTRTKQETESIAGETYKARGITDLSWTFIGTPAEINDRLEAFKETGVNYFEIKWMVPDVDTMLSHIKAFAEEIMPSWT